MTEIYAYQVIWFVLWGILWAVYFALDGYDLGLGMLSPILAESETEKRIMHSAAGPFWDGNEVWLLTAGGATFAAFPSTYAVMFSGLYSALMLLLFTLILRGVAMEFRNKMESPGWRGLWDKIHTLCSFLPALLLGVAFANIFKGIAIDANGINRECLLDLLNPYGLLGGILFVLLFLVHGALWLAVRTEGALFQRAFDTASRLWMFLLPATVVFLVFTWFKTRLFSNYLANPALFIILALAVLFMLATKVFIARKDAWKAFGASFLTIISVTAFGVAGLFPALLPSSLNPAWSMTIQNSSSSLLTLQIMLGVALVFVPVVIAYQSWSHYRFSYKITPEELVKDEFY